MPDVVNDVVINYKSTGLDNVGGEIKQLSVNLDGLVVSETSAEKTTTSLENRFSSLERQLGTTSGEAEKFARVQDTVNKAVAQNPELAGRGAEILAQAAERYGQTSEAVDLYAKALDKARESALGFAAAGGPIGAFLGSFGPWGVAAAAGIGAVTTAMNYLQEGANKFGDTSARLKQFAESTGLSISQVRALSNAAADLGVSGEQAGGALQRFTFNLNAARTGSGDLFNQLRMIDRGLADQIATAHGDAEALNILAKAYDSTADAVTKAAIARAAFGKQGASMGGILGDIADAGGVDKMSAALQKALGITDQMVDAAAKLRIQNKSLDEEIDLLMQKIYAVPVLERQNQFKQRQIEILKLTQDQINLLANAPTLYGDDPSAMGGTARQVPKAATDENTAAIKAEMTATEQATASKQAWIDATIRQASQSNALVAALGAAATAEEVANARIAALTASFEKGEITANIYSRAIAAVRDSLSASVISTQAMIAAQSTLGDLMRANAAIPAPAQPSITQYPAGSMRELSGVTKEIATNTGKTASNVQVVGDITKYQVGTSRVIYDNTNNTAGATRRVADGLTDAGYSAQALSGAMGDVANVTGITGRAMVGITTSLATAVRQTQEMMGAAGRGWMADQTYVATSFQSRAAGEPGSFVGGSAGGGGVSLLPGLNFGGMYGSPSVADLEKTYAGGSIMPKQTTQDAINNIVQSSASLDQAIATLSTMGSDYTSSVTSLYGTKLQQTQDAAAKAQITQQEIGYLQGQPKTVDVLSQIASLQSSLQSLTSTTDKLNATNQELLSPYYTQDPRTSHIGFRSQGMAMGGYVDVPGGVSSNDNIIATIPVASGERIFVDPMGARRGQGGGTVYNVSISSPVMIQGNPNKDEIGRTMFQNNQLMARQLRSALK